MRRVLVTGVSSGIGQAIASALLDDGWSVIGVSRRKPSLLWHDSFSWIHANLKTAWQLASSSWHFEDGLDALVHCAAEQGPVGPLASTDPTAWVECVKTNLLGTYHVVQTALPYLLERPDPRILLFAGGGAFNPRPRYSAYAASKAGVISLMESLAEEHRGRLTANCVSPGMVPTEIHNATLEAGPERAGQTAWWQVQDCLRDTAQMPKVVECVRHLLSPDAHGLTGKCISVSHDAWESIEPGLVDQLNASDVWTRTRVKWAAVPCTVTA